MRSLPILIVLFSVIVAFAGTKETEDETVTRAKYDAELKKLTHAMNQACDASINVKIDWNSFTQSDWNEYHVAGFCTPPVDYLSEFCSSEKGNAKAYIKSKIKSITCTYGGEGKRALSVKNGAINNIVDFKAPNLDRFIRAALLENL